jgi:hypothetical protein
MRSEFGLIASEQGSDRVILCWLRSPFRRMAAEAVLVREQ